MTQAKLIATLDAAQNAAQEDDCVSEEPGPGYVYRDYAGQGEY